MRKFLAISLALVMVLALSVTCLAVRVDNSNIDQNVTADVTISYVDGADAPATYAVDVTWESLAFEYIQAPQKWDAEQHKEVDDGESKWTDTDAKITVVNHSNRAVKSTIVFAQAVENGTVAFTLAGGEQTTLDAATTAAQDAQVATLTVSGVPAETEDPAAQTIGTITVTITEALVRE